MSRILLITMLLLISGAAHAQQSSCGGMVDVGGGHCVPPDVAFGQGSQQSAPTYRGPLWQDRYGAIALDEKTGSVGWASNAGSKKKARVAAIEDCGGGDCKVQTEVRNGCVATAWGSGVSGFSAEANLQLAEETALNNCKKGNGSNCKLTYSACSLPVRIR